MTINQVIDKLIQENKVTKKSVASFMDMSTKGLDNLLKNDDLKVSQLAKLSDFFKVPISFFFREVGYNYDNDQNIANEDPVKYIPVEKEVKLLHDRINDLTKIIELLENNSKTK